MALRPQVVPINFAKGLDTKTDPKQINVGNFLSLQNSIFDTGGELKKRNGYGMLPSLPDDTATYVTTFNGNLTALGNNLQAYASPTSQWVNKGPIERVSLNTLPLIRSSINQSQGDAAIASNGLVCTVYTDEVPSGGSVTPSYKYAIADSVTGQNIVAPTVIPVTSGTIINAPRVFVISTYFIIVFSNLIGGTNFLQYIAIAVNSPTTRTTNTTISALYTPYTTLAFDGYVAQDNLFIAWNGSDGSVKAAYIDKTLILHTILSTTGQTGTTFSITADTTNTAELIVYISYFDNIGHTGYTWATTNVTGVLHTVYNPVQWYTGSATVPNIASTAQNGILTLYYEVDNYYGYDGSIQTNFINTLQIQGTVSPTVGPTTVLIRSVGLASKAFLVDTIPYMMVTYSSPYQPTYFLINGSGNIFGKLAYSNGGGYLTTGLPGISLVNNIASTAYLIKDLISSVNKGTALPSGTQVANIYSQTGVNLVSFTIGNNPLSTGEIGNNLNISGALVCAYDGYSPVEQGFNVWPDSVEGTWSATGGNMAAIPVSGASNTNAYYYQVTYEWSDNQGNEFRSAPSIPVAITTTGSGTSGSVVLDIPTLRLTYKIANPVKLCVYRWSVGQQIYYQTTSIAAPILNDPTVDYLTFTDTNSDATILGNNILYTTGGVLEDIGPPASDIITLYQQRLWLVDSEDKNLLWFSKQVIEGTPVEMSDTLTFYVAPTTSSQGSTGPITALASLDDKLIIFKKDAIYYINGQGPDNTGANNQFSDPIFITAVVGCANQQSIVFMPQGLMFQSDKGIWLLGRDLSTSYIGAPVEQFNSDTVVSSINVPATNQIRFTLNSNITLMYDYYYGQWGTFINIPAVSSTLYNSLHTYINDLGQVFQETIGQYLDGSSPVLMQFTTGWISMAGLQGFERFYELLLLGTYITPFNLSVQLGFDYNSPSQYTVVSPLNVPLTWGSDNVWGGSSPWGGGSTVFPARIFPQTQKCETFQITVQEIFNPAFGTIAGAGLTLSQMSAKIGILKGTRNSPAATSFG